MPRKPHRQRYAVFLECLVEARKRASLTQVEVAAAFNTTQTFISKCERGERRLDAVDLLDFLEVFGTDPSEFIREVRERLRPATRKRK